MFVNLTAPIYTRSLFIGTQKIPIKNICSINPTTNSAVRRTFSDNPPFVGKKLNCIPTFPIASKTNRTLNLEELSQTLLGLEQEAAQGSMEALYALALCYSLGYGLQANSVFALELLKRAAKSYPLAMNDLGMLYIYGKGGVKKNIPFGTSLVIMAANKDCPDAVMNLGMLYETGKGVRQDLSKSLTQYARAEELGHVHAREGIDRLSNKSKVAILYSKSRQSPRKSRRS